MAAWQGHLAAPRLWLVGVNISAVIWRCEYHATNATIKYAASIETIFMTTNEIIVLAIFGVGILCSLTVAFTLFRQIRGEKKKKD